MGSFTKQDRPRSRRRLRSLAAVAVAGLVAVGTSAAVTSRATVAPSNNSAPSISGQTAAGSTLTANPGTWSGSTPLSFQYQWQVCDGNGAGCHDIAGATAQTYQVKSSDAGNTLKVRVIASNSDGSSTATSDTTAKIAAVSNAPVSTALPSISGQAAAGSTLTVSPGSWSGATPITFQYQWQVCDGSGGGCHDISGATAQTYQVKSSDAGNTFKVRVIASNSDGSSSATSDATAKVGAATAATSTTGCSKLAAGAQAVSVADVAAPARLQVAQTQLTSGPITSGMRSFTVRVQITDTCGNAVSGASVYATAVPYGQVTTPGETTTDASGSVTLTFNRLAGFPATYKQQLMVLFVRARRLGDPVLAGISTRRLVSLRVNLKQ